MGNKQTSSEETKKTDAEQGQTSDKAPEEKDNPQYYKPCFYRYITFLARLWGIILVAGCWAGCIHFLRDSQSTDAPKFYLLALAILVLFLEVIWMIDKCTCCEEVGCCCQVWKAFVWIDDWRKTILYVAFAVPCFISPIRHLITMLMGALLIVAAWLYFMRSFRNRSCVMKRLPQNDDQPVTNEATGDPTSRLVRGEQRNYQSVSPNRQTSPAQVATAPEIKTPHAGSASARVVEGEDEDEVEEVPVGYKFDYSAYSSNTKPAAETSNSASAAQTFNPYDYENTQVTDKSPAPPRRNEATTSRIPFDEDDSFEHELIPSKRSKNPFE